MSDVWDGGIPADVFEDILRRIPPCPRRRLRLVCRRWRDAIDEHTPEPRASSESAKVLAFFTDDQTDRSRAFVFDDLTAARSRELDLDSSSNVVDSSDGAAIVSMIGTCNGLLCLRRKRGDIVVTNPITGETVAVDLPPAFHCCFDESFNFAYHPATGQYKIVHRPVSRLHAMCVLTLGEGSSSWREVPVPHESSCYLLHGLVTIDGITYWTTANCERIVSFDLKDERVAPVEFPPVPVPVPVPEPFLCPSRELTDVGGRLGLVVSYLGSEDKTDVWVLKGGGAGVGQTVHRAGARGVPAMILVKHD